jgi:hypothetical protein
MRSDFTTIRNEVFCFNWPLDQELTDTASMVSSHRFLQNPAGQYPFIYLTRYVKAVSERQFSLPFSHLSILDWGCGKGHVSKLFRDLSPCRIESCDIQIDKADLSSLL